MAGRLLTRLPFLVAAALIAAAVGDPVVESVANSGVFGGHFADNNHTGIIPTLVVGVALVFEMLVLGFVDIWRRSKSRCRDAFLDLAKEFATYSFVRDVPYVIAMQIVALFFLESVEQLALGGKLLGGTIWLGGPILFSLITHALIGTGCTFALGAVVRALAHAFAAIVCEAIRYIWLAAANTIGGIRFGGRETRCPHAQAPHVRQIGGRAPPLLPTPA